MIRVLVVDENESHRTALSQLLIREGAQVAQATTYDKAHQIVHEDHFDAVIADLGNAFPRGRAGLLLTATVKRISPTTHVAIISSEQSVGAVVDSMRKGANDYIVKSDTSNDQILNLVRKLDQQPSRRHSKIVCTIGTVTESEDRLAQLIDAGMNVARLNFSHGDHSWHRTV